MANPGSNRPPVIIKRVRKSASAPHHGGAWKVAYADFVTAMMAFFLLLWLLNATTEEQKQAISDYFAPASVSQTKSGSGGMLGGRTFAEGAMPATGGVPGLILAPPAPVAGDAEDDIEDGEDDHLARLTQDRKDSAADAETIDINDKAAVAKVAAMQERRQFEQAAAQLRQAMQDSPDLEKFAASLMIDQTAEGLRIQIVDQDKLEMFPLGSSQMHAHTRELLKKIVAAIRTLPQQISVAGYTDATPYANDKGYSNWELSSDRAHASRRALTELGLDYRRITRVVGRADTDLLVPEHPASPRNRRISITLLRQVPADVSP